MNKIVSILSNRFRLRRFDFFKSLIKNLSLPISILDLGGSESFWLSMGISDSFDLTLLNLDPSHLDSNSRLEQPNINRVIGNACDLSQFADKSFDLVFSNSVIEHVGQREEQMGMANEALRVGKRIFIQTPYRHFPLDPHFMFPFFQYLPAQIQISILYDLKWLGDNYNSRKDAQRHVEEIQLLSKGDVKSLFPDVPCFEEKIFGLTKSLILYAGFNNN